MEIEMAAKFGLKEDGSIDNPKCERYLLQLVDGIDPVTAFASQGYATGSSGARQWRKNVENNEHFVRRRHELTLEKTRMVDGEDPWGEAKWQARQVYRMAVANNDQAGMMKATQMLVDINERSTEKAPAGSNPVGRPQTELPQTIAPARADLTQRLSQAGVPTPKPN